MSESRFTPGRFAKDAQDKTTPVVCLAELVSRLAIALPAPERAARATVLQRLGDDGSSLFVVIDPDDWARPVQDGDTWRPAMCTGAESWRKAHPQEQSDQYMLVMSTHMGRMDGHEALLRGLPLHASDPKHAAWMSDDQWRALPALPALQGRAGALAAFELCCVRGAAQASPDFTHKAMALAMTQADAERVFPELAPPRSFWEDAPTATPVQVAPADSAQRWQPPAQAHAVLHLAPGPRAATPQDTPSADKVAEYRARIAAHTPIAKTGRMWPDKPAMLAELLRQYDDRKRLPDFDADTAEEKIADLWKLSKNTVHTYLTEARKVTTAEPAADALQIA